MSDTARHSPLGLTLLGATLAVGLVLAAGILARTVRRLRPAAQTIAVKGFAAQPIVSDWGLWRATLTADAPTLAAAAERLERDRQVLLDYLREAGADPQTVTPAPVGIVPVHRKNEQGGATNDLEKYELNQTVELATADVQLVARLARDAAGLLKRDLRLQVASPEFYYRGMESLKLQMLGEATRNARARAEQLAVNSHGTVGPLCSANQGVFQVTPEFSTDHSDYGENSTATIRKTIKAVVTVEYLVE